MKFYTEWTSRFTGIMAPCCKLLRRCKAARLHWNSKSYAC